jgi:hypothetical protein
MVSSTHLFIFTASVLFVIGKVLFKKIFQVLLKFVLGQESATMSDDERDEQFEDAVDNLTENLHSQCTLTQADDCTDEAPDDLISDTHDDSAETDSGPPSPTDGNAAESEVIIDEVVLRQQEACMTEEEKQVCSRL